MLNFELKSCTLHINNQVGHLYIEFINNDLFRVYRKKTKNRLVQLNTKHANISVFVKQRPNKLIVNIKKYFLEIDESLKIKILNKANQVIYEDYKDEYTLEEADIDYSLAALEGHKVADRMTNLKTFIPIKLFGDEYIYGLGDKLAPLNRKGYEYVSWNTDDPSQHNENYRSLYKSISYFLVNHSNNVYYGIFYPSSYKTMFNLGKETLEYLYIASEKGEFDYFIILGDTPISITKTYAKLVGLPFLCRIKMLGNQQSRWSYSTRKEAESIVERYKEHKLPLDFLHLDIDYMQNYKVYTVDSHKFPNFKEMVTNFKSNGVDVVTIIDPAVKKEEGYFVYDEMKVNNFFATHKRKTYVNEVWPGESCYPNYFDQKVSDYVGKITANYMEQTGVSGIWCDMNEPASFRGPLPNDVEFRNKNKVYLHDEVHNLYGEYMVKSMVGAFTKQNKRPYLITRACFATSSPYTTVWNGDNQSLWSHLLGSISQVLTMSICNFPYDGVDIGGFGGDATKELLIRWLEANIFSLFLRNHSSIHTRNQEPFAFDEETISIYRKFLALRYELIPYLYDLAVTSSIDGTPCLRPLFMNYPFDENVKEINDEIMIGESLLLAPIINQGDRARAIYLPKGTWLDYFSCKEYRGGKRYLVELGLGEVALFVKKGSILPKYKELKYIDKNQIDTLFFQLYGDSKYVNYDDDGESLEYKNGIYNKYKITYYRKKIVFETVYRGYDTKYKNIVFEVNGKKIDIPFSYQFECMVDDE